jgi:uncharacterized membrane protein
MKAAATAPAGAAAGISMVAGVQFALIITAKDSTRAVLVLPKNVKTPSPFTALKSRRDNGCDDIMEQQAETRTAGPVARIVLSLVLGIILLPALAALSFDFPLHEAFVLVGSILIFQPVAAGIGIALNIPPVPVLLIMLSVGTAAIFIFFGICDLFYEKSAWLRDHLAKVSAIADRSVLFKKYGILMFIPFIWVPGVGLYGCVLLAWLFGWRDARAVCIILAGWMIASLIVVGAALGVKEVVT